MRTQTDLHNRIASQHASNERAMGTFHPAGTADTPMVMPLVQIEIRPGGVAVQDVSPIYVGGGPGHAPIPATAPHRWFQLYAAGRP